ncbi:hypothetical protein [Micromonospora lupini]|uniref:hypothetical protein n=1 Tax=Micromonospora lupini TaxID=285679 RepID=UPI0009FED88D
MLLLHGWPYDIHSFVEVVPLLTDAGYRVIVPHLRAVRLVDAPRRAVLSRAVGCIRGSRRPCRCGP